MHLENEMGSLETEKTANLLIVSDDPYRVPTEKLGAINIEAVIFDGKLIRGKL
jgi:imidazolonepropionase-like amidohydrolase